MTIDRRHVVVAAGLVATLAARPVRAQEFLEPAVAQYESADYEGALSALDDASGYATSTTDRVAIDHYRVLCLLALGRTDDAQAATGRVFTMHPGYSLDADSSPRVRALFDEVRARMLPELIRGRYVEAKTHFDSQRFLEAATGFAVVADLGRLARAMIGGTAQLDDLMQVASGFQQLATSMLERERARSSANVGADRIPAPAVGIATAAGSRASTTPSGPPSAVEAYLLGAAGVTPPVVISQTVSAWHRSVPRPRTGAPLGTVEVVIDEAGAVTEARILSSVSAFYDAVLLESAKGWRYRPAMKEGRPVRFRRSAAIVAGG
jgi:hypothetical protein